MTGRREADAMEAVVAKRCRSSWHEEGGGGGYGEALDDGSALGARFVDHG